MKKLMPLLVGLVLPLTVTPQILESDSLALVDFYNALDGDNWVNNDSWLSSPVEEWHGITIDAGRVTRIRLTSNGLSGTIPLSFNDLESLEEVYLTSNEITSPLPDMSNLTNVTTFAFYDNNLNSTFPESIRNLTGIRILNLGSNSLTGELPEWLPELNRLEDLSLTTNNLNGEIIEVLRDLPNLEKIRLFGNEFSGPLPDFSIFSSLKELVVGRNDFTGTFPGWITEIDSLRYLHLGDCELSGTVPENLFSQLYPGMRQFVIYGNDFTGQLENILDAYMPEMFRFNIAGNNFTGYIPDGVFDVHNVYRWNISNNDITGLPDFSEANHTPTWFYCTNNKIGFEHLETCLGLQESRPGRLQLGPQNALLEEENLNPNAGEDILIDCGSRG
ncbi:MAG: hypothetical protein R3275_10945, partial [Saprospiraceae bacterium]|nr:hypothetical protein [Saprospiraceae bacterium]